MKKYEFTDTGMMISLEDISESITTEYEKSALVKFMSRFFAAMKNKNFENIYWDTPISTIFSCKELTDICLHSEIKWFIKKGFISEKCSSETVQNIYHIEKPDIKESIDYWYVCVNGFFIFRIPKRIINLEKDCIRAIKGLSPYDIHMKCSNSTDKHVYVRPVEWKKVEDDLNNLLS